VKLTGNGAICASQVMVERFWYGLEKCPTAESAAAAGRGGGSAAYRETLMEFQHWLFIARFGRCYGRQAAA
jgi:hypothetical protein